MIPSHRIPAHPGEILKRQFLEPLGLSQQRLAEELGIPIQRLNAVVRGRRAVSADTALRLAEYFKTSPQFWMNLQSNHDLAKAAQERARPRPRVASHG